MSNTQQKKITQLVNIKRIRNQKTFYRNIKPTISYPWCIKKKNEPSYLLTLSARYLIKYFAKYLKYSISNTENRTLGRITVYIRSWSWIAVWNDDIRGKWASKIWVSRINEVQLSKWPSREFSRGRNLED